MALQLDRLVDVDIRDLSHTQDSIKIGDGTDFMLVNADGSINAVIPHLAYADDSVTAHQGGTWTIDSITDPVTVSATDLDVRDLTHVSDSVKIGDGTDLLAVNADGSLNVAATLAAPGTAIKPTAVTVGTSAVALPTTALTGRKKLYVQNRGAQSIFLGDSGVTTSSGIEVSKFSTWSDDVGAGVSMYAISGSAGMDVRVLEIS